MRIPSKPDETTTWRSLSTLSKAGTVVVWAVFVMYLVLLFKLTLFARVPGAERSLNLIPFASIAEYLFTDSAAMQRFALGNVLGNVVAFIPLGAYLPFVRRRPQIWSNLVIVAGTSIAVEILQGIFGLGASDIDDVILNTLGGLVGILFFLLVRVLLRRWSRIVVAMAVLSLLIVPILWYLLFVIMMRM